MHSLARAPRARLGALLRHHLGARATRALSARSEIIWLAVAPNNAGRPVFLSALVHWFCACKACAHADLRQCKQMLTL